MDGERFDNAVRVLATARSRRQAFKTLGGRPRGALAAVVGIRGAEATTAAAPRRTCPVGQACCGSGSSTYCTTETNSACGPTCTNCATNGKICSGGTCVCPADTCPSGSTCVANTSSTACGTSCINCNDDNPCTSDTCDAGTCAHTRHQRRSEMRQRRQCCEFAAAGTASRTPSAACTPTARPRTRQARAPMAPAALCAMLASTTAPASAGCETNITTITDCGGCGVRCTEGTPGCCGGRDAACTDLNTDVSNCGACGTDCTTATTDHRTAATARATTPTLPTWTNCGEVGGGRDLLQRPCAVDGECCDNPDSAPSPVRPARATSACATAATALSTTATRAPARHRRPDR